MSQSDLIVLRWLHSKFSRDGVVFNILIIIIIFLISYMWIIINIWKFASPNSPSPAASPAMILKVLTIHFCRRGSKKISGSRFWQKFLEDPLDFLLVKKNAAGSPQSLDTESNSTMTKRTFTFMLLPFCSPLLCPHSVKLSRPLPSLSWTWTEDNTR